MAGGVGRADGAETFWSFIAWSLYLFGSIGYALADGLLVIGIHVSGEYIKFALVGRVAMYNQTTTTRVFY